ncbi:MAG TPA: hypothetical protein VM733_22380 [Thermoanaerobaculia bacterium]|nr:hypothetical protein [Thermoanaerobaculia bacterium]
MGKIYDSKDLLTRRTSSSLLAVSLAASLAAFGCTTNLNPGNGSPVRSGSEIHTAPTSGLNSGSESAPVTPPPMTSNYTRSEMVPAVKTQQRSNSIHHTAAEAAAIMAGRTALRGRYLGPASPGSSGRAYASDSAGGFVNPAMLTNPQPTINSSISSSPTSAINSGAGGSAGIATAGTTTGTTAAATVAGTDVTTTAATTTALPVGAFAAVRPTATESISNNPAVTAASAGAGRSGVVATRTTATTPTAVSAATTSTTAASTATAAAAAGGVRLVRGATGVTITNASSGTATTTAASTSSSRSQ